MLYLKLISRLHRRIPIGDKRALADYLNEVYRCLDVIGEGPSVKVDVNIILDELITNIFLHGYGGAPPKDVEGQFAVVSLVITEAQVIIRIRDWAPPFNPLEHKAILPGEDDGLDDLRLGGLGVFMVRERVSNFDYKYIGGQNVQTLIKDLPAKFYKNNYFYRAHSMNDKNEKCLADFMSRNGNDANALDWKDWRRLTGLLSRRQQDCGYKEHFIPLTIGSSCRRGAYKVESDYSVNIQVCSWGSRNRPALLCLGGILNTAERFGILARALSEDYFVIGVTWAGRGKSDWLVEQDDYNLDSYVAHVDAVLDYFGLKEVTLLGSSLGGSVAMRYLACAAKGRVNRLILNDTGYIIPASRRARRSIKVGRHYKFTSPQDILRRYELATRAEAYIPESFLLLYAAAQTKEIFSGDYVYNHDYRALLSYRREACDDLDLRAEWDSIDVPILLLHGNLSTALPWDLCNLMMEQKPSMRMMEIKHVGHTPPLTDEQIIGYIGGWMSSVDMKGISRHYTINPRRYVRDKVFIFNKMSSKQASIKDIPLVREFYVVRHGLTSFNSAGLRCGSEHDVSVSSQGIKEAISIGLTLKERLDAGGERDYSRIYCGGLQRLMKTAHIIGSIVGMHEIYCDNRFDERRLGEYSGTPHDAHESDIRDGVTPTGGESESDFSARVEEALNIVMHHVAVTPIIITSRGVIIRMLRMLAEDFSDEVKHRNLIYRFIYDIDSGTWCVEKIKVSLSGIGYEPYAHLLRQAELLEKDIAKEI